MPSPLELLNLTQIQQVLNRPAFRAHQVAAQTPPAATYTLVAFDTVDVDNASGFNAATHEYTVPLSGLYSFESFIAFTGSSVFHSVLTLYVNGAEACRMSDEQTQFGIAGSAILQLAAGAVLGIYVYLYVSSALDTGSALCWWGGHMVSQA